MADEAKLHSSIRSTFEELVMRRVVRHCLGPFLLTSAGCRDCNFQVRLIDLLSVLLRCNSFAGIQKAVVDQMGSRPPNSDHDLSLVQVWLWEVLWSFFLVQPLGRLSLVVI